MASRSRRRRPRVCRPRGTSASPRSRGEGDVWLTGGTTTGTYGMWHSTNSGATFTKIAAVDQGRRRRVRQGRARASYPAIYTSSKISGSAASPLDRRGATWVRINDDRTSGAGRIGRDRRPGRVRACLRGHQRPRDHRGQPDGHGPDDHPPAPDAHYPTPTPTATPTPTPTATSTRRRRPSSPAVHREVHDQRLEHRLHGLREDHQREQHGDLGLEASRSRSPRVSRSPTSGRARTRRPGRR